MENSSPIKKKLFEFPPEESFFSLPILQCSLGFFILLSILASICIVCNTDLYLDLSAKGFNSFISIFKFPLGVLTLIIPVVALLATNHRSEQAKKQILLSNEQNNFQNYYKHLEEFIKYGEKKQEEKEGLNFNLRYLHSEFFPHGKKGNYSISDGYIGKINEKISEILETINEEDASLDRSKIKELCEIFSVSNQDNFEKKINEHCRLIRHEGNPYFNRYKYQIGTLCLIFEILNIIKFLLAFENPLHYRDQIDYVQKYIGKYRGERIDYPKTVVKDAKEDCKQQIKLLI